MKIAHITSEMAPFARTGGLGEVCASLPLELAALGHEIMIFLPRYRRIPLEKYALNKAFECLPAAVGSKKKNARVFTLDYQERVKIYFIDCPEYFDREELYGIPQADYPDNDERFVFFQRAAMEIMKAEKSKPDIIHAHDWQAGLIPVYLKYLYKKDAVFKKTKSVFTIHNLAYQGNFPPDSLPTAGLDWEHFHMNRLEFYGKMSFLKGGLVDADVITTVSPRYAAEIKGEEFGCGMEGVLRSREKDLYGIVNGISQVDWNPAADTSIFANYSAEDMQGKAKCKEELQKECGFAPDAKVPLFAMISRLVDQKGLDILLPVIEKQADKIKAQFVILGTGSDAYHRRLKRLAQILPERLSVNFAFDEALSRRIYAGADVFLMPSRFEPCGLGQMIAMRYGTVPLVRETGGLADTVIDAEQPAGNGLVFQEHTAESLEAALLRAEKLFAKKKNWQQLISHGMRADFSWAVSAKKYVDLYSRIKGE